MKRIISIAVASIAIGGLALVASAQSDDKETLAKSFGEICSFSKECSNGLSMISCQPEVDGPIHYVDPKSRKAVYTCGEMGCFDASNSKVSSDAIICE